MSELNCINGFYLESCRLSKSSYSFEFDDKSDAGSKRFLFSTSHNLTRYGARYVDVDAKFSEVVWPFIELPLEDTNTVQENGTDVLLLQFEIGSLAIWADKPQIDNLAIITDQDTGEWFTFS